MNLHEMHDRLPTFAELPDIRGHPKGCTWGLWDRDGKPDELGTLNLLTPDIVRKAVGEVQWGISVSLK